MGKTCPSARRRAAAAARPARRPPRRLHGRACWPRAGSSGSPGAGQRDPYYWGRGRAALGVGETSDCRSAP